MPSCHVCEVSNLLKMESSRERQEIGRKKQSSFSSRADWAFIKVLRFTLFLRSQGPYLFFDWTDNSTGQRLLVTEKIRHFGWHVTCSKEGLTLRCVKVNALIEFLLFFLVCSFITCILVTLKFSLNRRHCPLELPA